MSRIPNMSLFMNRPNFNTIGADIQGLSTDLIPKIDHTLRMLNDQSGFSQKLDSYAKNVVKMTGVFGMGTGWATRFWMTVLWSLMFLMLKRVFRRADNGIEGKMQEERLDGVMSGDESSEIDNDLGTFWLI